MTHLRINKPAVVHETMDGEVVVVNLDKGLYFSIDGVGAAIWSLVGAAYGVNDIVSWGRDNFSSETRLEDDFAAFLASLREHELVEDVDGAPAGETDEVLPAPATYRAPAVNVYSDMEDLLLLDPIHEVDDDAGWPRAADA